MNTGSFDCNTSFSKSAFVKRYSIAPPPSFSGTRGTKIGTSPIFTDFAANVKYSEAHVLVRERYAAVLADKAGNSHIALLSSLSKCLIPIAKL